MSGFTRNPRKYGNRLVYEVQWSKWDRYHGRHCGCGLDYVEAHIRPAGFEVLEDRNGYIALTAPGFTIDVDEQKLTTNMLWEAITGKPGTQDYFEPVIGTVRP